MKRLLCIVGETSSGKDTVAKYLTERYNLMQACSATNRAPRAGEVNGREHWFLSEEEFRKVAEDRDSRLYTKIEDSKTGKKGYEYCMSVDELGSSDVLVVDPNGARELREAGWEITVIYVTAKLATRKKRAIQRDASQEAAFIDRCENEEIQFSKFRSERNWDYVIWNESSPYALKAMVDLIMLEELTK